MRDFWLNRLNSTVNRRKMLGGLLTGVGATLAALHVPSVAQTLTQKGRSLLENMPTAPKGLEAAVQYPLLAAIHGRRARRFSMGASIPDGPLAYTSKHAPMPLSEIEQLMVLTATAGTTGWINLHAYYKKYLPNIPNYAAAAGGRTFPSSAGFHTSEIFFTDDSGIYFMPTRDLQPTVTSDANGDFDLNAYLQLHKSRIKKLSDKRLYIPENPAHLDGHNHWCVNRPGSTLIIPVGDLAQHALLGLCFMVQNGAVLYDDINKRIVPGIEKYEGLVDTKSLYPLSFLDQLLVGEMSVEIGTACYSGMLTLQAMGLGGWMFDGIMPTSVLGASGDPEVPGLGFQFQTDERWPLPNVTGLPGVFEGHCPPHYPNMRAAVEAVVKRKFGPGGPFNSATPGPYKENAKVRGAGKVHDERFVDCVTLMADYIYNTFGKFPATAPPIYSLMYLQAHHLDLDFYNEKMQAGSYLQTHVHHMEQWHA